MLADLKRHGFDLESSHLRATKRLQRLSLLVSLLYLWLIAVARRVELAKLVDRIDRHDRHDLSLFRLGRDFVDRYLALADPIPSISPWIPVKPAKGGPYGRTKNQTYRYPGG